jgi:PAS domain-containing protein
MNLSRAFLNRAVSSFTIARGLIAFVVCISTVFAWMFFSSFSDSQHQLNQFELSNSSSRAALYAERVNALIYAVVMESRGIYMSTEPEAIRNYGENLLKLNDKLATTVSDWEQTVGSDDHDQFLEFKERINRFISFRRELVRRGIEIGSFSAREWGDNDANRSVRSALNKDLEALSKIYERRTKSANSMGILNRSDTRTKSTIAGVALFILIIGAIAMARFVIKPLSKLTQVTVDLAKDVSDSDIPFVKRRDEIGKLARAVETFQATMMRNLALNQQALDATRARETALNELHHRTLHLTAAADNMTSGLIMLDQSARLVACNQIYRDMYGLSHDITKSGTSLIDILKYRVSNETLSGDPEQYFTTIVNRIKSGVPSSQESELADGRTIQVSNRPMEDGGWVATHSDVTAARNVERRLEQTEMFLATVLEKFPDTVVVQDARTMRYMFVNRAGEILYGISRSSMIGKTANEIFSQETVKIIDSHNQKLMSTRSDVSFNDYEIDTPGHGQRKISALRYPICGQDGKLRLLVEIIQDKSAA